MGESLIRPNLQGHQLPLNATAAKSVEAKPNAPQNSENSIYIYKIYQMYIILITIIVIVIVIVMVIVIVIVTISKSKSKSKSNSNNDIY